MDSILDSVYRTLISAVRKLEKELDFATHDKFGWLTLSPCNIGTTLNCHVRMKLNKPTDYLQEICEQFHLIATDVEGIECAENDCIIDISNKRVFGLSEFDCMKTVYFGVKEIIRRNSNESQTEVAAEEENLALPTDEPQAEISLNSVHSNGTYTKEQVEPESVVAPDASDKTAESIEESHRVDDNGDEKPELQSTGEQETKEPSTVEEAVAEAVD